MNKSQKYFFFQDIPGGTKIPREKSILLGKYLENFLETSQKKILKKFQKVQEKSLV